MWSDLCVKFQLKNILINISFYKHKLWCERFCHTHQLNQIFLFAGSQCKGYLFQALHASQNGWTGSGSSICIADVNFPKYSKLRSPFVFPFDWQIVQRFPPWWIGRLFSQHIKWHTGLNTCYEALFVHSYWVSMCWHLSTHLSFPSVIWRLTAVCVLSPHRILNQVDGEEWIGSRWQAQAPYQGSHSVCC